jgi:hypothetical protein
VILTPSSSTPNLVSLLTSSSPSILFAQTTNTADAKSYKLDVSARPTGATI